ncbi:MAG: ArsC/Spx/MgsR family protein [Flavobacteriales bacterium]|nr:ArsC/Spx/MgsR family protein [Flavobacteriales bacterium]
MKKIYYLKTCSTCIRILKELNVATEVEVQDIKTQAITENQLSEMKKIAGSYEALFSRKAMKYRKWNLHEKVLSEQDYKFYILEDYTFLKRPVIMNQDTIFIGNSKQTVELAKKSLHD